MSVFYLNHMVAWCNILSYLPTLPPQKKYNAGGTDMTLNEKLSHSPLTVQESEKCIDLQSSPKFLNVKKSLGSVQKCNP